MDILSVKGQNFLALEEFYIETEGRGLLLIQGENKSDSSTESNGAGKSSIADAISWCIYGVTARGLTGDKVVNNHFKKNAMVEVILKDGGTEYSITRYRKHETGKNEVRVYCLTPSRVDLSKGTDKETQLVINGVMGCTADVFNAAIYAGQGQMPNLPAMTDKNLKLLLEEAAGTEELSACYATARQRSLAATKNFESAKSSIEMLKASHADTASLLEETLKTSSEFEEGRKTRARETLSLAVPYVETVKQITADLAALPESEESLRKSTEEIGDKLNSISDEKKELVEINKSVSDCLAGCRNIEYSIKDATTAVANLKAAAQKAKDALDGVEDQIGQPCSECGKPYCAKDLETVTEKRRHDFQASLRALKAASDALESLKKEQDVKKIKYDSVVSTRDGFEAGMTDVSAEVELLKDINGRLSDIALQKSRIERAEAEIARLKAEAGKKLTEPNPHVAHVELLTKRVTAGKEEIDRRVSELEAMEQKVAMLNDAVAVFSPGGVRAHILDLITPFLNDRTRDYLGALSDGNIHAVWSTLTKTAKGDLKEKFNIDVSNDLGGDSFQSLSGGEQRKVRLATAMALQEMVASRASKPINLFIADEIDDALDDAGMERLMGVLEKRSKDSGTVLVISHNSLSDWISDIITVEKNGKTSTVSGATMKVF